VPDILYIHPAKHDADAGFEDLGYYFFIPVGVLGLVNLLRQEGLAVKGINYPAELMRNRAFRLRPWLSTQRGVKLVLVDLHWYMHSYGAIRAARACKQVLPGAQVVLGGITASLFAGEILRSFPEVDFVIRGDAEQPLLALAQRLCSGADMPLSSIPNLTYRSGDEVVENELNYCATPDNLDNLDFVDLDFLEQAGWYGRLQFEPTSLTQSMADPRGHWLCIGRGCRYDCSFCGGGRQSHKIFAGRNGFVLRSAEKAARDIQRLAQKGVDQVSLNLDPAILPTEYWRQLFAQVRRLGVRIGINNELFQLPTPEFVEGFCETADVRRSELALSLLSGSEKVRRLNGKHYTNQKLFEVVDVMKAHQVPLYVYFSFNLPGEDEKAFRQTLRVAQQIRHSYPPHLLKIINMAHTLDPCSPMSRKPQRYAINIGLRNFKDYYKYCQQTLAIQAGEGPWKVRGFAYRKDRTLQRMVRQWNEFCAEQPSSCFRVPESW
jgi:tRNA A37 methylthiotransferase MiaB